MHNDGIASSSGTRQSSSTAGAHCENSREQALAWPSCFWLRAAWLVAALLGYFMLSACMAADFVIVVDVSGSMAGPVSRHDKRVRVEVVQDALRQYLPALPAGSRVDLIAFSTGIVTQKETVLNDDHDLSNALDWVDGLAKGVRKDGNTHLWTTLRHALQTAAEYSQENPAQPVTVRVLTDGEDNEGATTLDKVLQEFLPVLDGEKIRGNLVLLGDLELKTKLSLPEGAFETSTNPSWQDIFPPIVMWAPTEPRTNEEVRLFENNTKSIYKGYEWQVEGKTVGKEKVLSWRFAEPRSYRVTLKVTGLQGTLNSASVLVRVKEPDKVPAPQAAFRIINHEIRVGDPIQLVNDSSGSVDQVQWLFDGQPASTVRNPEITASTPGEKIILLAVRGPGGTSRATESIIVLPRYTQPVARIHASTLSGKAPLSVQFTNQVAGDFKSLLWNFGDGQTSTNGNPWHTYLNATNCVASLTVYPMDGSQARVDQQLAIKVIKPWPLWAKATAATGPCLILIGGVAGLIFRRRRQALRLPVHFWAEQAPVCRTVELTKPDQVADLGPAAGIRLKRAGKSQDLVVRPVDGSSLVASDGTEVSTQSVGDGVRVLVKSSSGTVRAVAISTRQKPRRPAPAAIESAPLAEDGVCGLQLSSGGEPAPAGSEDFDWGWNATAATKAG